MTKKDVERIQALLYRTERNIDFYIKEEMHLHLHNEIGVMRGLIYAMGLSYKMSDRELSYIDLQNSFNNTDKEEK